MITNKWYFRQFSASEIFSKTNSLTETSTIKMTNTAVYHFIFSIWKQAEERRRQNIRSFRYPGTNPISNNIIQRFHLDTISKAMKERAGERRMNNFHSLKYKPSPVHTHIHIYMYNIHSNLSCESRIQVYRVNLKQAFISRRRLLCMYEFFSGMHFKKMCYIYKDSC